MYVRTHVCSEHVTCCLSHVSLISLHTYSLAGSLSLSLCLPVACHVQRLQVCADVPPGYSILGGTLETFRPFFFIAALLFYAGSWVGGWVGDLDGWVWFKWVGVVD